MKTKIYAVVLLVMYSCSNCKKQLELRSNSEIISITDGSISHKNNWKISPDVKIDEFVTAKFKGKKKVSFISDIDTLTLLVKPNKTYDFIIKYDNKDAHTRINTDTTKKATIAPKKILEYYHDNQYRTSTTDTIPFYLGNDNGIHFNGKINNSKTLDFLFDTGANANVIVSKIIEEKVNLNLDGKVNNTGSDGMHTVQTSSSNKIKISDLNWNDVKLLSIDYKNPSFDALIGWIAFENKIIELDYDKNLLIIHQSMETVSKSYSKIETKLIGGLLYMKGEIMIDDKVAEGWFEHDSGYNGSFSLSHKFSEKHDLESNMAKVGTSYFSGSAGVSLKANDYIVPILKLGKFKVSKVPVSINEKDPDKTANNEILGNNLLKRFNTVIDLKNFEIHLKPNKLFKIKF